MNPLIIPAAAVIVMVPPAAIFTGWHLIRDRRYLWKPGKPMPVMPAEPLYDWECKHGTWRATPRERQPEMAGRAA